MIGTKGQAAIELLVSLLVIVLIVAGLIQFAALATARSDVLGIVRGTAGRSAMTAGGTTALPLYLRTWEAGDDQMRYTTDDVPVMDNPNAMRERIVARSAPDAHAWSILSSARHDDIVHLHDQALWSASFGFVRARESQTVPLMGAIRNWVYAKESVTVAAEVWLPRTGDLY